MAKATSKGKLDKKDRRELAKQLITTGHLAVGGLLLNQLYSGQPFHLPLGFLGALILAWTYVSAIAIMKGGGGNV